MPLDPLRDSNYCRETDFSWGPGLVPPGKERATPEEGGKYRGRTPRAGRPSARDSAPGNPGYRVR